MRLPRAPASPSPERPVGAPRYSGCSLGVQTGAVRNRMDTRGRNSAPRNGAEKPGLPAAGGLARALSVDELRHRRRHARLQLGGLSGGDLGVLLRLVDLRVRLRSERRAETLAALAGCGVPRPPRALSWGPVRGGCWRREAVGRVG